MNREEMGAFYLVATCPAGIQLRPLNAIGVKGKPTTAELRALPALIVPAQVALEDVSKVLLNPVKQWPIEVIEAVQQRADGSVRLAAGLNELGLTGNAAQFNTIWKQLVKMINGYAPASEVIRAAAGLPEEGGCPIRDVDASFVADIRDKLNLAQDSMSDGQILSFGDSMCTMLAAYPTIAEVSEWVTAAGFADTATAAGSLIGATAIKHLCPELEDVIASLQN